MKRSILSAVCFMALAAPAFADMTVKASTAGKGLGMGGTMATTTFIKGSQMRSDIVTGDTTRTTIIDLDTMKMYSFDSSKKEADVYDMTKLTSDIAQSVQVNDVKASVNANGKTKEVAGKSATGYDVHVSVPATMGGKDGMKINVNLIGPVWIVKGGPGTEEYIAFYKNAVEKGWFFIDPRSAKAQPGQAKAMAEMYRQLAATGGIPYEQEMTINMSGEGPLAGVLAKMGDISITTTITSVETGTLAADMFAVPPGYKLKEQN